jgi:hypothetical protein
LPDYVCCITSSGKIIQTNSAFDKDFTFSAQELEKGTIFRSLRFTFTSGVYTWSVFTELASDFFRVADESQEISTLASRRFGESVEVSLCVRNLKYQDNDSSSSLPNSALEKNSAVTSLSSPNQPDTSDEAYVIIAKNTSGKHVEVGTEETKQIHAFERKFREKQFRDEIKKFCDKNKAIENVLFLEQVQAYKKSSFGDRVDMKQQILDRYIKEGAPMQLNLGSNEIVEETIKINKCIADFDVFKTVEGYVFKILSVDIYPRLLAEKEKGKSDTIEIN